MVPDPSGERDTRFPLSSVTSWILDLFAATRCRSSPYRSAMTRRLFAGPFLRNGPRPSIAEDTTSDCASPELNIPASTETTLATDPSDAIVDTISPEGPQVFAPSHLVTPG